MAKVKRGPRNKKTKKRSSQSRFVKTFVSRTPLLATRVKPQSGKRVFVKTLESDTPFREIKVKAKGGVYIKSLLSNSPIRVARVTSSTAKKVFVKTWRSNTPIKEIRNFPPVTPRQKVPFQGAARVPALVPKKGGSGTKKR